MNFEVKYIGLSTAQVLWNQWYQSALIVDDFEEKFASKRWVTCHQIDLTRNQLLPIVISTCLDHFWLEMVVNKENIMVQCLHVCPAEHCILKLQAALIVSYWHREDSLTEEGMLGWSILIMEPILLGKTSN